MSAGDALGKQWTGQPGLHLAGATEYPVKGWRKTTDRVTAQQRLMGAGRGYDPVLDAKRKGITPHMN